MSETDPQTTVPPKRSRLRLKPGHLIPVLLAVEGCLWLSDRLGYWHKGYAVLITVAWVGAVLVTMLLWFAAATILRRRFQFCLRSLLVLVVAVALPCSWLAVRFQQATRQSRAVQAIRHSGGVVCYGFEVDGEPLREKPLKQPPIRAWLSRLVGTDIVEDVVTANIRHEADLKAVRDLPGLESLELWYSDVTDCGLINVRGLKRLRYLFLEGTKITNGGLKKVAVLTSLERLSLANTAVSDRGLADLNGLERLRVLSLEGTKITDAGLKEVAALPCLEWLSLSDTAVTDVGLEHLRATRLEDVDLEGTRVTQAGVTKLQQALPNCMVTPPHRSSHTPDTTR